MGYTYLWTSNDASILVLRSLCFFICYEILFRLLKLSLPEQTKLFDKNLTAERFRTLLAINSVCAIHATICSLAAFYALFYDGAMYGIIQQLIKWDYESLFETIIVTEETIYCSFLVTLSVGYFSWDLYHYKDQEIFEFVMILHHLISIIVWPMAVYNGVAHFFLLFMMFTELSSPLMYLRWYLKTLYGKEAGWLSATVAFVFTFTFVRMIPMPYVLFGLYSSNSWEHSSLPFWLQWTSTSTLYLPSILNIYWYSYILSMCFSFLCGGGSKEKET
jgi:hypothetical protein